MSHGTTTAQQNSTSVAKRRAGRPAAVPGVITRTTCRSCESSALTSVLNFGNLYVSNFADSPDPTPWPQVPLDLVLCAGCSLLQLRHTTPPDWMYRQYWYKSGVNISMRVALAVIAQEAAQFVNLTRGDQVLDIGCNDGTLLRSYATEGIRRVGFDPAGNLGKESAEGTDRIINDYFSAAPVRNDRFRVITSIAMFYDLEDPNAFVADVASILASDGAWVIEMHYLPLTLARNAFDAVCHEHLEYYSLASLEPLLARHQLEVADVETNEVNGGSVRVYVVHAGSEATAPARRRERVQAMRDTESLLALEQPDTYIEFGERIRRIGAQVTGWLQSERARGKQISVYGASTKGNTLLQVFGLDHSLIHAAADRNPVKWGKYTVGSWIPIVSEEAARATTDNFLILPWHFLPEMKERERSFLMHGGKLLAPLPEPRLIDAAGVHALA